MITVGVITASDKGSQGLRQDLSGKKIIEICKKFNLEIKEYVVVPDEITDLKNEMIRMSDVVKVNLIFTTGGTGFSKRDVTPEATKEVIEKEALGIVEAIRSYSMALTKRAMLSRATSGIRGSTLIINLPGSPKAVEESLEFILESVIHGVEIMLGHDAECART